jgi:hypothetical protein
VIALLVDHNFDARIINGLRRRQPALDVLLVREIGLAASDDPEILARAASEGRVLLTHDIHTMPAFAYARVAAAEDMPGVFVVKKTLPIGQAIDQLLLAVYCLSSSECQDRVMFFPM